MVVQIGKPRKELEMDRMEREAPGTPEVPVADLIAEVQQSAQMQQSSAPSQPRTDIDYFALATMHYPVVAQSRGHCGTFAELPAAQQKGLADFVRMCIIQAGRRPK
jgi:hypothetical protein